MSTTDNIYIYLYRIRRYRFTNISYKSSSIAFAVLNLCLSSVHTKITHHFILLSHLLSLFFIVNRHSHQYPKTQNQFPFSKKNISKLSSAHLYLLAAAAQPEKVLLYTTREEWIHNIK